MRTAFCLLAASATCLAQLPEFNMLVVVEHGVVAQRTENGLYHYSTATNTRTRLWPPSGTTAGWSEAVKGAQYSPDASQVAAYLQLDRLAIMNRDGSSPQLVSLGRPFKASVGDFAWTSQGIFWYEKDLHELVRYVPSTGAVSVVATIVDKENTTSFGGLYASRDGSRMWSWLTLDHQSEVNASHTESKPYIFIDNNDHANPRIRYNYFWGHGNMMLPDGSKTLHIGWDFTNGGHPFLWVWNWDTFTQDSTLRHGVTNGSGVAADGRGKGLVQVANSADWIGMMFGDSASYLWNWSQARQGALPQAIGLHSQYYDMSHIWMGAYPGAAAWGITETEILLSDAAPSDTIHITGWSDAGNPTVQSSETWTGTPVVSRNSPDIALVYTVAAPPVGKDTAVITVTDAAAASRTCRIVWNPSLSPAERLAITPTVTDSSIGLSWVNTLGAQFTFAVRESTGTWGPAVASGTQYTDDSPQEGNNAYRVAAISGTDTSWQQLTVYWSAPASITILSPVEGAQFSPAQQVLVRWTTEKVASVQIELSINDGESYSLMTQSAIDLGDSTWSNYTITMPNQSLGSVIILIHPYQQTEPRHTVTVSTTGSAVTARQRLTMVNAPRSVRYYLDLAGRRLAAVAAAPASPVVPVTSAGEPRLAIPVGGSR